MAVSARVFVGCWLVAAALACNALSGVDGLIVTDNAANGGSSSNGGTSSAGGSASNGGTSSSGGSTSNGGTSSGDSKDASSGSTASSSGTSGTTPDPKTPIHETFDSKEACEGKTTTNGATARYSEVGRNGSGACILCAGNNGKSLLQVTGSALSGGTLKLEAYASRLPGVPDPAGATVVIVVGSSSAAGGRSLANDWVYVTGASGSTPRAVEVAAQVGIDDGHVGDCILIDDIKVTLEE